MKFTPEQVIEMAREAELIDARDDIGTIPGCYRAAITRLCTLAADRALEAAANVCDNKADSMREMSIQQMELDLAADAIRAMKEHQ